MSKISFEMKPVEKKRAKLSMKRSVYDPILDQFLESGQELVEISVEGKRASYVVTQLARRIKSRELDIIASSAGDFTYLEKTPPEST